MSASAIEPKNGVPYLARTRPSDLEPVDSGAERSRNHDARGRFVARNDAGRNHSAKRTLTRSLRAAAQEAAGGAITPEEAREVAQDALTLYGANRRSVGCSSPIVLARLLRNAVNDVLADRLTAAAVEAGIATERGMALLDLSHKCEARAERSMTAALAFARTLADRRDAAQPDPLAALFARPAPRPTAPATTTPPADEEPST